MGNTLADHVVQPEERPSSSEDLPLSGGHPYGGGPDESGQRGGQLGDGGVVDPRHHEGVAREERSHVEEPDEVGLVEHHVGRQVPSDYGVEHAVGWFVHGAQRRATMLT